MNNLEIGFTQNLSKLTSNQQKEKKVSQIQDHFEGKSKVRIIQQKWTSKENFEIFSPLSAIWVLKNDSLIGVFPILSKFGLSNINKKSFLGDKNGLYVHPPWRN